MSRQVSRLGELWRNLKKTVTIYKRPELLVGKDEHGNQYFEKPADHEKGLKQQRRVESGYQEEIPKVPVEWMAWLQGRRKTPPLEEEINHNFNAMLKTQIRSKELEERRKETPDKPGSTAGVSFPKYPDYKDYPT